MGGTRQLVKQPEATRSSSPAHAPPSPASAPPTAAPSERTTQLGHRFEAIAPVLRPAPKRAEPTAAPVSPGRKLPEEVQAKMEASFGTSLSDVRIHEGTHVPAAGALAYTQGTHIHFAPGRYAPNSPSGQRLLGHELTHVVQQARGPVRATLRAPGLEINDDSSLERQADQVGARAARGEPAGIAPPPTGLAPAAPTAQRAVIQRVGGPKVGLQRADGPLGQQGEEAIQRLQVVMQQLKQQRQQSKRDAQGVYDRHVAGLRSGETVSNDVREQYTTALRQSDIHERSLRNAIARQEGFTFNGDDVHYNGAPVASLRRGADLYARHAEPTEENGLQHPVYKKHTLEGLSAKEYVRTHQGFLRRTVTRGILPTEAYQLHQEHSTIRPLINDPEERREGHRGYHYNERARSHLPRQNGETDLGWLNRRAGTDLERIPDSLLPFLQERKGATKLFSARSTSKEITSNHGSGFSSYGEVDIDLAKVPREDILHQYNDSRPDLDKWNLRELRREATSQRNVDYEAAVASDTSLRNREVHLSSYPRAAVRNTRNLDQTYIQAKEEQERRRRAEREAQERRRAEREERERRRREESPEGSPRRGADDRSRERRNPRYTGGRDRYHPYT